MTTTLTVYSENNVIGDILKWEEDERISRKLLTLATNQTISLGQVLCGPDTGKTALPAAVNEVQTITFGAAMTAGTLQIAIKAVTGQWLWFTQAWDTNWATTMAAFNTKFDAALGASKVVMTGTATVPVLTFSGTGYAGLAQELVQVNASAATGVTTVSIARTATGGIVGAGANAVSLQKLTTGASTASILCVVRDAIVDKARLVYGTNVTTDNQKTAIDALLEACRIFVRSGGTYGTIANSF